MYLRYAPVPIISIFDDIDDEFAWGDRNGDLITSRM